MRQFRGKFLVHFAPAKLRQFRRNEYRLQRFFRIRLEQLGELLPHFFGIDVPDDNEGKIVGDVSRLVILHHLLLRQLIVNLEFADDREAIGMLLVSRCEKEQPRHAIGIIHPHGKLAPDDFLFFLVFFRRQSRIDHSVRQNVERGGHAVFRHVDPKNGAIERRVRIDVAAHVLDFLRDLIFSSGLGSLEQHVLENVRQPCADMLVFVDASRGAPRLHAGDGRAVIFLDDHRQPVWQNPFLRRAWRKSDDAGTLGWCSFQVAHTK